MNLKIGFCVWFMYDLYQAKIFTIAAESYAFCEVYDSLI